MNGCGHKLSDESLPSKAGVVIVSGGVIGCSVAYHFAKLNWTDVG
jgi:4-methylaminobutanoate oxidase (formaldehyde-forming)